jgi:hypothetical protein
MQSHNHTHWELLYGKVPDLFFHAPTVTHPDHVGDLHLMTQGNVHAVVLMNCATVPPLDLPPRESGKLRFQFVFDWYVCYLELQIDCRSVVLGNRIVWYVLLGMLMFRIWNNDALV